MRLPKTQTIPLDRCVEMDSKNPNVLGPERYELLVKGIREHGFVQPVLVYERDDEFVVIDGVHRCRAAREAGLTKVSAVIADGPDQARMLRLSLNRLRGELDQTVVGQDLLELAKIHPIDDLDLSGFTTSEVSTLIDMASETTEEDLLSGADLNVESEAPPRAFNLVISFAAESERAQVKEALTKIPGQDDAQRLRTLLNMEVQ